MYIDSATISVPERLSDKISLSQKKIRRICPYIMDPENINGLVDIPVVLQDFKDFMKA